MNWPENVTLQIKIKHLKKDIHKLEFDNQSLAHKFNSL